MSLIPDREVRLQPVDPAIRFARIETALAMLQQASERIERKLDTLIASLAEQDDELDRAFDLEGNPLPAERDPNEPL